MNNTPELVSRAKKGDAAAFETLMHAEKEKLYKMAFVYTGNEEDALEVFQETVYKAFKSISMLQDNHYFSTWLTRILINTAIAYLKSKQKIVPLSPEILDNLGHTSEPKLEDQLDLLAALETLEEKYKTVLLLRFYQDYSIKQISDVLNCPEGTVKTNIHRGLASLRKFLKGVYTDDRSNSFL